MYTVGCNAKSSVHTIGLDNMAGSDNVKLKVVSPSGRLIDTVSVREDDTVYQLKNAILFSSTKDFISRTLFCRGLFETHSTAPDAAQRLV